MDMPPKKKGSVAAKSDSADEGVPRWLKQEFDQTELLWSVTCIAKLWRPSHHLKE